MPEILDLPSVRVTHQTVFLRRICRSAGRSLIGIPQRVGAGLSQWEVEIGIGQDHDAARVRAFEAFVSRLDCTTIVRMAIFDAWRYGAARSPAQQPFSDGTWFSDGTGFALPFVAPLEVTTAAAAGENTLWVDLTDPVIPPLESGDYFSVDGFLYQVTGRTGAGWVKFAPRARKAIPVGTILQTDPPVFYGYPTGDDFGSRGRGGPLSLAPEISLTFTEAFDR